ncbi:MAG: hypothetical protein ACTHK7_01945 [Aureliella sp.]
MSKIGAFVRTSARSSLRKRKRVSLPGQPPSVHTSDKVATLKNILFGYEPKTHSVVIGPVRLNSQSRDWIDSGSKATPGLLERGGVVTIQEERWKPSKSGKEYKWHRRDTRRAASESKEYRTRRATFRARPFMAPALERERSNGKLISAWKEIL